MTTKVFYIDDAEHTVTVSGYTGGYPAKTNCDPDDGYEGCDWEIELEDEVEVDEKPIPFDQFITAYAKEHYEGDESKAVLHVESECQQEVIEQGNEYNP